MLRRIALALLALLTLAVPYMAVLAQAIASPAPSTYRLRGFLNRNSTSLQGGAATGSVTIDSSGNVTAGNITYNAVHPTLADTTLFTGGAVTGDGHTLEGQFLTGNTSTDMHVQGFTPTSDLLGLTSDNGDSEPDHLGLLVGIREGGTFSQADLASSSWRFKALAAQFLAPFGFGGDAGWAIGSFSLAANRSMAGGTVQFPDHTSVPIPANADEVFNIDANGTVTGFLTADFAGLCGTHSVDGVMSPDKTIIAAVMLLTCDGDNGSALVLFQRDPSPMTFALTDLTGTYDLIAVDHPIDPADGLGQWIRGNVTVTSGGVVSGVFVEPFYETYALSGSLSINSQGFICAGSPGCPAALVLTGGEIPEPVELRAVITADKKMIDGVFTYFDDYTIASARAAVFTLVRRPSTASTFAFSAYTYSTPEGNTTATITVLRAGDTSGTATVDFTTADPTSGVSATADDDYVPTSGTLTFGPEVTTATFMVTILDDTAVENTERVKLILSNPTNGATLGELSEARLRILDNDSIVEFSAAASTRGENAGATSINVTRTGYLGNTATVSYTIANGTATAGLDYNAAAGVLTFEPGVASVPLSFTILQDTLAEGPETIGFQLSGPTGNMQLGAKASAVVTITDDDVAGTVAFSSARYTATEGGPAKVITVVRRGGAAGGVTVRYATSNGSATAGSDYTARSGTLAFGPGQMSRTFSVPILDDSTGESAETVRLTLSNPTGGASLGTPATALLTIEDNEPVVAFTGNWVGRSFEVRRTGRANVTVTVEYAATDGTAVAGVDYAPLAGTLTFGPGVTRRLIPIRIIRDTVREGPETFTLFLRNPVGARLGDYRTRLMVIKDND